MYSFGQIRFSYEYPVVGIILLIIFALGGAKNINLRNFARSYFCIYVIIIVVFLVLLLTGGLVTILNLITGSN